MEHIIAVGTYIYATCNGGPLSGPGDSRVQKFSSNGVLLTEWGSNGTGNGQFRMATGITRDLLGRICVVDSQNRRVQAFSANGDYIAEWSVDYGSTGSFPQDIASDGLGAIYITYASKNTIRKYDFTGRFLKEIGCEQERYKWPESPSGIAVAPDDGFYLSDSEHTKIFRYDAAGCYILEWGDSSLDSYPYEITSDDSYVYSYDRTNRLIQKHDPQGQLIAEWDPSLAYGGQFGNPARLSVGRNGNLYVLDLADCRMSVWDTRGNLLQQWGRKGTGPGEFRGPMDLAVDEYGNAYVADFGNSRIQKFNQKGDYLTEWPHQYAFGIGARDGTIVVWAWRGPDSTIISKYDYEGNFLGSRRLSTPGVTFNTYMSALCINRYGDLLLLDSTYDRNHIYRLTAVSSTPPTSKPDGAVVYLKDVIVTAGSEEFGDCFYVESPDRSSGIRVTGQSARFRDSVTLYGVLTTKNGEREISAISITKSAEQLDVRPFAMNIRDIGGSYPGGLWGWRWIYNPATRRAEYKWAQLEGLSNVGLLVTTWGSVHSVDSATGTYVITDGKGIYLKCQAPATVQLPEIDQFVCTTGISIITTSHIEGGI